LKAEGQVFEISKAVFFEAAHFMGGKPEGHPYRSVHGHSFRLEATVAGIVKPGEQWVEDFSHLTAMLEAIEGLEVPTLERICLWAAADLGKTLPGLARVAVARPSLNERCELVLKRV
jgi:6-pyruvoyltetrahydropterin/6-carboxytetrahydropterin synthase